MPWGCKKTNGILVRIRQIFDSFMDICIDKDRRRSSRAALPSYGNDQLLYPSSTVSVRRSWLGPRGTRGMSVLPIRFALQPIEGFVERRTLSLTGRQPFLMLPERSVPDIENGDARPHMPSDNPYESSHDDHKPKRRLRPPDPAQTVYCYTEYQCLHCYCRWKQHHRERNRAVV